MARVSPLRKEHQHAEASFLAYGSPGGGAPGTAASDSGSAPIPAVDVVETFGELESEYAAIRKGALLVDWPQRGTIEVGGADRVEFLNRMVTQGIKDLQPFRTARTFLLDRKGRIDAGLPRIRLGERMLIDVDIRGAGRTAEGLAGFVFAEDFKIADSTEGWHRLALHGPTAAALLREVSSPLEGPSVTDLQPGMATMVSVDSRRVIVDRWDSTGEVGLELSMDVGDVGAVWRRLIETGVAHNGEADAEAQPGAPTGARRFRLRAGGWAAYNIARIEAGTALYNIDFGPESLPAESGVAADRVSFTKGCYLGQEVVARMHALGHPKQMLVALRVESRPSALHDGPVTLPMQPVTGGFVYAVPEGGREEDAEAVGAITSSALAPMLSGAPVALAQVKWKWTPPGTQLLVDAENARIPAVVQDGLRFWPKS
ncbi:MAG: aminomethyl transferase family protein [Phycisphaerales bacterium]|nr:aminomethyl transferase family protein [Phycisphaerales bacterium]